MEEIESFLTGMFLGGIFAWLKLPIPAPDKLSGVLAVLGIFLGYIIVKHYIS